MNLIWFRNDLRLDDHPALYHACQQAGPVRAVYIATPKQWQKHHEAPAKLAFRSAALHSLTQQLSALGIPLELLQAHDYRDVASCLADYCQRHQVKAVYFNQEIPLDEQLRDKQVVETLGAVNVSCHQFNADLLVPQSIMNQQGKAYRVFTPWYRAWLKQLAEQDGPLPSPANVGPATSQPAAQIRLPGSSDFRQDLWPASEQTALQRLSSFTHRQISNYAAQRDFPATNGTSTLSPYLASGLLSPRRCLMAIQQATFEEGQDWRESLWLRELAWREFYRYLMLNFPHLSKGQPFKTQRQHWPWQHNPELFKAWQTANTGFPIIDAAMTQLLRTGWMHNRLRMLTAGFLCKLLLLDWRQGEQFFMQHLIDGDFASNNGGWQWSSSSGCDAAPWFRIFNPTAQSEKFDPKGEFIRTMLPKLAALDNKQIHNPSDSLRKKLGYPAPTIDYKSARERALESLK